MRILAVMFGAAAALAVAAPVAADPGTGRVQLAQAQDSGMQSGSSTGARQQGSSGSQQGSSGMSQQGSAGQREGGTAATRQSSGGGAAISQTQGTSRTTVRQRSEGARVSVRGGSRTAVGVRSAASDDAVFIKRKKARRYVYSEPSTTVIRKKKRFAIHEPSSSVIVHKRRAGGVAVGGGTSTRTTVPWVSKVPVAFEVTARLVVKLDKNCSVPAPAKVIPPAAAPRLLSAPTASVPAAISPPCARIGLPMAQAFREGCRNCIAGSCANAERCARRPGARSALL
jgi:hypothetical protein